MDDDIFSIEFFIETLRESPLKTIGRTIKMFEDDPDLKQMMRLMLDSPDTRSFVKKQERVFRRYGFNPPWRE